MDARIICLVVTALLTVEAPIKKEWQWHYFKNIYLENEIIILQPNRILKMSNSLIVHLLLRPIIL